MGSLTEKSDKLFYENYVITANLFFKGSDGELFITNSGTKTSFKIIYVGMLMENPTFEDLIKYLKLSIEAKKLVLETTNGKLVLKMRTKDTEEYINIELDEKTSLSIKEKEVTK